MKASRRESGGGGKAPSNTVSRMAPKGAGPIKNSRTYSPKGTGLGMVKGAVSCPNGGGRNSKY